MIGMSDGQVLGHFKDAFPPKIKAKYVKQRALTQPLQELRVVVLWFQLKLPQDVSSSMLAHITERTETTSHTNDATEQNQTRIMEYFTKWK